MKKHELLAPAGDMESLYQAVYNGADAVYLSGHNFGARKFAKNFSNEELVSAIKFCHLYGVKIYVTMNTLVYNNEIDEFINQVRFLHKNGVDALIVQDFGMICLLREKFPNLEIHASTQANNSSKESCELLHKLGVKRVVLSRELSIDEIDNIKTPIEKEVFIHGALCISYSGRCLMSSMLGGRSGNRGACAGCCRMEYSLIKDNEIISKDKYLLSTKELNTTSYISRLLDSSIDSFKIEGRMKSPLYVGFITNLYRRLIDGNNINLKEEINKLKTIFNREFTKGRLFYENDIDFINTKSPNHIGLKIGRSEIYKDKIKIVLDDNQTLNQNDAIRFQNNNQGMIVNYLYDSNLKLCNSINKNGYVDNKWDIKTNDIVYKTQDSTLEKEYLLNENRYKIPIVFIVEAKLGKKLLIKISDKENEIEYEGNIIEKSISMPTTKETIIEKLQKIHNTPFQIDNIEINMDDNIFIQIKQINDIKRYLIQELIIKRENKKKDYLEKEIIIKKQDKKHNDIKAFTCSIINEEQLKECLNHNFIRIYVSDYSLYEKYKNNQNVYYQIPKCSNNYENILSEKILANDIFNYSKELTYGGYQLNNTNKYTGYYLNKIGLKNIPISCEMTPSEIINYIENYNNYNKGEFEILSYGRVENMIIKGNILNIESNNYHYKLIDSHKRIFPVYYDGEFTHILNHEKRNIKDYIKINCVHRLDFYEETKEEIKQIVNMLY